MQLSDRQHVCLSVKSWYCDWTNNCRIMWFSASVSRGLNTCTRRHVRCLPLRISVTKLNIQSYPTDGHKHQKFCKNCTRDLPMLAILLAVWNKFATSCRHCIAIEVMHLTSSCLSRLTLSLLQSHSLIVSNSNINQCSRSSSTDCTDSCINRATIAATITVMFLGTREWSGEPNVLKLWKIVVSIKQSV